MFGCESYTATIRHSTWSSDDRQQNIDAHEIPIDTDSIQLHRCRPSSRAPCRSDSSSGYTVYCCCRRTRCNGTEIPRETARSSLRRCCPRNPCRRRNATTCWRTAYYCSGTRWARIRADLSKRLLEILTVKYECQVHPASLVSIILTAPHLVGSVGAVEFTIANVRFGNTVAVAAGSLIVLAHLRRSGDRLLNCAIVNLILRKSSLKTISNSNSSRGCVLSQNEILDRKIGEARQKDVHFSTVRTTLTWRPGVDGG